MTPRRSAFSCISPAIDRMAETCFRPFRFGVWARLALIVFLAGEVGSQLNLGRGLPGRGLPAWTLPHIGLPILAFAAALGAAFLLLIFAVFAYLNARARFVLMETVFVRTCRLSEMWRRWRIPAGTYFVFNLVLVALAWAIIIPVGFNLYRALRQTGAFSGAPLDIAALAGRLGGTIALLVTAGLVFALVTVFAKDFLVPVLALERHDLGSGVSRLQGVLETEPGAFLVYIVAKIVLAILTTILMVVVIVPVMLVLAIPFVILAVGLVMLKDSVVLFSLGLAFLIAVAVPLLLFVVSFLYVPVAIFFEALALEFFSDRFPPLLQVLHPAAPLAPAASPVPVPEAVV